MGASDTRTTVSLVVAAEILGISYQLLRYRAERGDVRVALRRIAVISLVVHFLRGRP